MVLGSALIIDGIRTEKQLLTIITSIVDSILNDEAELMAQYAIFDRPPYNDIDKLAMIADIKIQLKQIRTIKRAIIAILKRSSNKMILASIEAETRLN